jgi:hypothetical protein
MGVTATVPGVPMWVIMGLTQSLGDRGVITTAPEIFAVASTRQDADDALYIYGRSTSSDVIDVWIEESTLVTW